MMATCKECFYYEACECAVRAHGGSFLAFEYFLGANCPRFKDKTKYVERTSCVSTTKVCRKL